MAAQVASVDDDDLRRLFHPAGHLRVGRSEELAVAAPREARRLCDAVGRETGDLAADAGALAGEYRYRASVDVVATSRLAYGADGVGAGHVQGEILRLHGVRCGGEAPPRAGEPT